MISEHALNRRLLIEHVSTSRVMQLATLAPDGSPTLCTLTYHATFAPDRLHFVAHVDRMHARNLRHDPRAAGTILTPHGQGTTFTGTATETDSPDPVHLAPGERVFHIAITEWLLFDEHTHPGQPRRVIPVRWR
ncbi:pyridoxamine 5'-phosphate oxidase family protein [Acrocarpospora pleiomorpha]|nr:pyridoxamine 5'-phosphate oxidase family protein [Acrocarpospora pleiomorpha]